MQSNSHLEDFKHWRTTGFIATVIIVILFPVYLLRSGLKQSNLTDEEVPQYVGRATCIECHKKEYDLWLGSHHDLAMDTATDKTVLANFNNFEFRHKGITHRMFRKDGKFFINTNGINGRFQDFQIAYTFGYTPLQQYLIPFDKGKLQCLPIAWDTEKGKWFHLADTIYSEADTRPDNWLYWTNQAQNWNGMCADCHSTNLQKNFDSETGSFNTTWSEIDVSCEACHGPASRHIEWAKLPEASRPMDVNTGFPFKSKNLNSKELLDVCARCHSRRSVTGDFNGIEDNLNNYMLPALMTTPTYHVDGQIHDEDYEYASFTQSKMFTKDIKCMDCHDVHSARTIKDNNELCLQCHLPNQYNSPEHHFHKMEPQGNNPPLVNRGEPEYKTGTGAQCVNCHMVGRYYMGNDYRRDHSFRIPRPDLTISTGTPNACNNCHKDKTASWSLTYIQKWYGNKKRPHYGETFALALKGDINAVPNLILYTTNELYPLMVRATAVHYLGSFTDSLSNKTIEKALYDPEPLIRHTALLSYHPIDAGSYEKVLMAHLNDPVKTIRTEAAIRLSQIPENQLSPASKKARNAGLNEYSDINLYNADFPGGNYNLGIMYANLANPEMAAKYYEKALKIDPLFYMAKVNLAMLYNQMNKKDQAEVLFKEVIKDYPEYYELYYSLGLLLAEKNKFQESVGYLETAAKNLPQNTRIYYNLALIYQQIGNNGKAEQTYKILLAKEPENLDYLYATAFFYAQIKEKQKARILAELLLKKYPEQPYGSNIMKMIEKN